MNRAKNKTIRLDRPVERDWTIDLALLTAALKESLLFARLRPRRVRRLRLSDRRR